MRIVEIIERTIPISRYADPSIAAGNLTTSIVAVKTDALRDGRPVVGCGYASVGRYGQSGLIRERFAPRLLSADDRSLCDETGKLDPRRAWQVMMTGEKPGGHGERCVAVGALDMAMWDAAAKMSDVPLYCFLANRLGMAAPCATPVPIYAGGGYPYPEHDEARLCDEIDRALAMGFTRAKIKVGQLSLIEDRRRAEIAARKLGGGSRLAIDAMNTYGSETALEAASAFKSLGCWWFEDVCDPHDFVTQSETAAVYPYPIAAGEALFSLAEAKLLDRHGGLRRDRDVLVFDPVHCYGVPNYLRIVEWFTTRGWPRTAFWPHGGHLFALHLVTALGLGGMEVTPFAFAPFHNLPNACAINAGLALAPDAPGIGFELDNTLRQVFARAVRI